MFKSKLLSLHSLLDQEPVSVTVGEMAEWSNAPVLKTGVLRGTGGSNPSLSAVESYKSLIYRTLSFYAFK